MLSGRLGVNFLLHGCKSCLYNGTRTLSSTPPSLAIFASSNETFRMKVRRHLGLTATTKGRLTYAGYKFYIKIADEVNYRDYFKICEMDDTFLSWFLVMELHIWMIAARVMAEEDEGRVIRNSMIRAMWADIDVRSKKLEGAAATARREQVRELNESFQASLLSYDEGLFGNDKVLAGALWRKFFRANPPTSQEHLLRQIIALEMLVLFVRCQFKEINNYSKQKLILQQKFDFLRFNKDLLLRRVEQVEKCT